MKTATVIIKLIDDTKVTIMMKPKEVKESVKQMFECGVSIPIKNESRLLMEEIYPPHQIKVIRVEY